MATHRGRVEAVMLGVGAAFDFLAGTKRQAPRWMMRAGLEWLFRLASEPRRLALRYLKHNPRFVVLFLAQLCGWRSFR
jgi:N-acetylglucosaminyldiphosphoundecaprenol N-acetyl-beta-D-mannosaminyltransferase